MASVEQADFNCCGGCLIPILGLAGLGVAVVRSQRATNPYRLQLIGLMTAFVIGTDRSRINVYEIHSLLLSRFADDNAYAEVTTAAASFMPGGTDPFYNEARLAEAFRVFLRGEKIPVPDAPQDQRGVWPPPPNPDAR